jgi:hypothetical protein
MSDFVAEFVIVVDGKELVIVVDRKELVIIVDRKELVIVVDAKGLVDGGEVDVVVEVVVVSFFTRSLL